jgi:hypothetical protein
MRTSLVFAAILFAASARADGLTPAQICAGGQELSNRVHLYEVCIAGFAKSFEVSGDTAESVATASVSACGDYRVQLIEVLNQCYNGSGLQIADSERQRFHDYGVLAVIQYRTERLESEKKQAKSK